MRKFANMYSWNYVLKQVEAMPCRDYDPVALDTIHSYDLNIFEMEGVRL